MEKFRGNSLKFNEMKKGFNLKDILLSQVSRGMSLNSRSKFDRENKIFL